MGMDALYSMTGEATDRPQPNRFAALAPRPRTVAETGLSPTLLDELVVKHLSEGGVMTLADLSSSTALAGSIVQEIVDGLRRAALIEVRPAAPGRAMLRYALTEKGRAYAFESFMRCGYAGPAPVPLDHYAEVVRAQSVHKVLVTREQMRAAFSNVVLRPDLLDELGAALHSGRSVFIYGPPGSGKTYICRRLSWMLGDAVLVPHALAVGDTPVTLYDPVVHRPAEGSEDAPALMLEHGFDPRFVLCERPVVVTGGELTLDMLEVSFDSANHLYRAPLQLVATNGMYIIDDLGRQRVAPVDLFNRWIIPLESRQDFLSLNTGKRFPVPFDTVLVFSTNLNPHDLADAAFLRRIGHKIRFGHLSPEEYQAIWKQICETHGVPHDAALVEYVIEGLHRRNGVPLLACHPRDLIGMALDKSRYLCGLAQLTRPMLDLAWNNYFVNLELPRGEIASHPR